MLIKKYESFWFNQFLSTRHWFINLILSTSRYGFVFVKHIQTCVTQENHLNYIVPYEFIATIYTNKHHHFHSLREKQKFLIAEYELTIASKVLIYEQKYGIMTTFSVPSVTWERVLYGNWRVLSGYVDDDFEVGKKRVKL